MAERKIMIPFPTPASPVRQGFEVGVEESTEKWTNVKLEDGTELRIKPTVLSAVRIDGEYDNDGNPAYLVKAQHLVTVVSVPEKFKRQINHRKIQ